MGTLNERYAELNRPVKITIVLPAQVLARSEQCARDRGQSRGEALVEAVEEQNVRRAQSANRQDRLELQKALRVAKDQEPIEELLERFRKQMGETAGGEHKDLGRPLTAEPGTPMVALMTNTTGPTLRQRREALKLSRERLARLADVSTASIAQFEGGFFPKESKVLGLVEAALRQQERIAA